MPSLLKHTECPACGHRHHFCFIGDNLVQGREYVYVCPETGKKAALRPTSAAEVVHASPQGAVALTPAVYEPAPRPGHVSQQVSAAGKPPPKARLEGNLPQAIDTGALPEERLASLVAPAVPGLSGMEREVHEIGREMQGLAVRVGELAEKVATAAAVAKVLPTEAMPPSGVNEPEAGPTQLQEVLPDVKKLAGKVGGMEQLSDIVETLKETKK